MIKNKRKNNGVAPVIGVILMIATFIVVVTVIQSQVIPVFAQDKESDTHDKVYSQMFTMSDTILDNPDKARTDSLVLDTKTDYVFGDFSIMVIGMTYTVSNNQDLSMEIRGYNGSETFLNGKSGSSVTYSSDRINLNPEGSIGDYSSVGLEHGIVYQNLVESQNVVNDDVITLPVINAAPEKFTTPQRLNVQIDSKPYSTTTVNATDSDFEIELETTLSEDAWNDNKPFEEEKQEGYVSEVRYEDTANPETNDIIIDFESGRFYTVKLTESDVTF